jgi:hypothetical protein
MAASLTSPKRQSVQQRTRRATEQLRELTGAEDVRLLSAAVTEAAAGEAERSAAFRATVRRIYEELRLQALVTTQSRPSGKAKPVELVPLPGTEGARFDPFAPLDPYALLRLYGPHQLGAALSGYSASTLREAAGVVRQKHPKTKPTDARKVDSLIGYIVQQLTEIP